MSQIKTSDVTLFIKDMIDLTMVFEVDDQGYVIKKNSGDRVMVSDNGDQCPLIVYQEVIKDNNAVIVNPLAENLGAVSSSEWFFHTQKIALLARIFSLFIQIIKTALNEKKSKKDSNIPMELLNIAARIIDGVDERLLEEFIPFTEDKETNEFATIWYQRKQLRSVFRFALFDEDDVAASIPTWRSKFPKIRKKTWPILETIMLGILNIKEKDDISKFNKKASEISCARLSSFLNVLLSVYQEINPLLDAINPDIAIDLSKLAFHINNLTAYSDNAKFMVQISRNVAPVVQQPSAVIPGIPMTMPAYPQVPGFVQPAVAMIPGPVYADGRPSPPIPLPSAYPQGFTPMAQPMGYNPAMYQPPQQPSQLYGQQQGYGQNIPFDGPYVTLGNNGLGNVNLLPPGAPLGFNPNYR